MECVGPKAKDADLWILIWEELHKVPREGTLVEGQARQSARIQEREAATLALRKKNTEGNEKADEVAKNVTMMDGGGMAQN